MADKRAAEREAWSDPAPFLQRVAQAEPDSGRVLFLCIGSDRSTGDAFGPLAGSLLRRHGWRHVIGTLEEPCDARSVEAAARRAMSARASEGLTVIAIDACLGKPESVGMFLTAAGPLRPGAATARGLPPVGDYSIAAVVNRRGATPYAMLQSTSLNSVMGMARGLVSAINAAWYIHKEDPYSQRGGLSYEWI